MLSPLLTSLSIWDPFVSIGSTIIQPLYWVVSGILVLFHSVWSPVFGSGNGWTWALSIVSLTVVIRVALIPLFVKQIKSSRSMQLLQPKVRELQKKYGHDREKLGAETMKLYKENNANPLASCLPLLIQMPIFFALYWVLVESVELRQAPWLGWIQDLTARDPYFILPVLNIAIMWATQKLTPTPGMDPMQAKMMQWMPVVMGVMFAFFPAGLVLYWVTNGSLGLLQQWLLIRKYAEAPATT